MAIKIIVAHPGRQHSFQTALALKRHDMLSRYVTTVYNKESSCGAHLVQRLLPANSLAQFKGRRAEGIDDENVVQFCQVAGLLEIALYRMDKTRKIYRWWHDRLADRFGEKVAKLAIREHADAVIMYDTTAKGCFTYLKRKAPEILCLMDVSAANRLYMRKVYLEDERICPPFAGKIRGERGHLLSGPYCARLEAELKATDYFLAPSAFVKKSLEYSGIQADRIPICPYGTNFSPEYLEPESDGDSDKRLRALYVGNVAEMKGIYYLLQAASQLQREVKLTLVGAFDPDDPLLAPYCRFCHFVGRVSHNEVLTYLKRSDVFVLPSLGEGFSLSILEAMSVGRPCIVSENSGADSAIEDGRNGFVVPIQSVDALKEKLLWCAAHRDRLTAMGRNACETAKRFTWEAYGDRLAAELTKIIEKRDRA